MSKQYACVVVHLLIKFESNLSLMMLMRIEQSQSLILKN